MAAEVGWRGGRSALEPTIIDKEQRTEGHNSKATEGKAFIHFGDLLGGGGGGAAGGAGGGVGGGGVGGGSWRVKEIDLDVQMPLPSGWEKRLDMKSGEVYFHNCNAPAKDAKNSKEHPVHDLNFPPPLSLPYTAFNDKKRAGTEAEANKSTSPEPGESQWLTKIMADRNAEAEAEAKAKAKAKTAVRGLEELNFMGGGSPNSETKGEAKMKSGDMEEGQCKLDLKLSDAARPHVDGSDWEWQWQSQSVCTLDKVKMALKRAEKEGGNKLKGVTTSSERPIEIANIMPSNSSSGDSRKRSRSMDRSPSSSSGSSLCLSMHNQPQTQPQPRLRPAINLHCNDSEKENKAASSSLQAAGCPRCLLYVLLPKTNPKCPRCGFLISTDFLSSSSSSSCSSAAAACKKPRLNGLGFDISVESNSITIGRDASQVAGSNGTRPSLLFDLNTVSLSD